MWVDQSDAITFKEGEEVTFIRWGNFFIDSIVRDELGSKVISMKVKMRMYTDNNNLSSFVSCSFIGTIQS